MAEKLEKGDKFFFGSYPQGNDDEKDPIEWEILSCKDGKVTLLSKYILDVAKGIGDPNVWCEDVFKDAAFSEEEQKLLCGPVSLPSYNDIAGHFSHRQLVVHGSYTLDLPIGCFGEDLIGSGTEYAVKKGLTVKKFTDEILWTSEEYRQGFYSEMQGEYRWENGPYNDDLKNKSVSCYMLRDGRYVDFDTTLRDEEKTSDFFDTGDTVYGIRPVICIKPSDPGMFLFENLEDFFEIVSGWEGWKEDGNFLRSPATGENIEAYRNKYIENSGKELVIPEEYVRFLKFSDGLAYGTLVMFGIGSLCMKDGLLYIGHADCDEIGHNAECNVYYDIKKDRYYVDRESYVTGRYRTECFGLEKALRKAEYVASDLEVDEEDFYW